MKRQQIQLLCVCVLVSRWAVCVALCCVVLLVVVCNLLGLVLGPLGLTPSEDPTKRSCTADSGGTFLVMWVPPWFLGKCFFSLPELLVDLWPGCGCRGAGFSFLFSWLFMIVVVLLFLVGGNVYTLVCRPWNDGQLLKVARYITETRTGHRVQKHCKLCVEYLCVNIIASSVHSSLIRQI